MADLAPLIAAGGIVLASLIAATYTIWLAFTRIRADERREFGRWLAEQRLKEFTEAHSVQRLMVFSASQTLKRKTGIYRDRDDSAATPSIDGWLSLNDQLRSSTVALRLLGSDLVADHLEDTHALWWADPVVEMMRSPDPKLGTQLPTQWEKWRYADDGGSGYLIRAEEMVQLARKDLSDLIGPKFSAHPAKASRWAEPGRVEINLPSDSKKRGKPR
ncbi:MAG: hypothetical protein AAF467_14100 [Actinomycetota bacterium]